MNKAVQYIRAMSAREKKVSGRAIANHLGITDVEVRKMVNKARSEGIPICSTAYGYYYSDNAEDIRTTVDSLRRRIESQERAVDGLSKLLMNNGGTT